MSFDTIRHSVLLDKMARRVQDPQVMHLVKQIIKVSGNLGVAQGGPFSPLAANIYLNEVDWDPVLNDWLGEGTGLPGLSMGNHPGPQSYF